MLKKTLLLILLLISCTYISFAQADSLKYTLKTGKINVKKKSGQRWLEVPVTITNNTNDTLRYATMTCSWQDFYSVDNKQLKVEEVSCDKNMIDRIILAPAESNTVLIKLYLLTEPKKQEITFRIGHTMILLNEWKPSHQVYKEMHDNVIVWSKSVYEKVK